MKGFIKLILAGALVLSLLLSFGACNNAKNGGKFIIELYLEYAPLTVENFVKLVGEGFYDGVAFHRIVDDFMAQGGDPQGTGMGGSGNNIPGEFSSNGFEQNTLSHTKGVISMARSGHPDSASSQFFIMLADGKEEPGYGYYTHDSYLDGNYAAFGKVIEGMEVLENLQGIERTMNDSGEIAVPVEPVIIKKAVLLESDGNPKIEMEIEY